MHYEKKLKKMRYQCSIIWKKDYFCGLETRESSLKDQCRYSSVGRAADL